MAVITAYPGASPEKVEQAVTKPLEKGLSTTSGIKEVQSLSLIHICSPCYRVLLRTVRVWRRHSLSTG